MPSLNSETDTFHLYERLIKRTALEFWRNHPRIGSLPEVVSEANVCFVKAYRTYDENRGEFSTWLVFQINKGLLESMRKHDRRNNRAAMNHYGCFWDVVDPDSFDYQQFLLQLPPKAAQVVQLLIEHPEFHPSSDRKNVKRGTYRKRFVEYLDSIGWTAQVIAESFNEIANVLNGQGC